jgi:hypothetical protein
MRITEISAAAHDGDNEDLIAIYRNDDVTDIVIIDGGSSVAEKNYIDNDLGDVVWFVKNFSLALGRAISANRPQAESVLLALRDLRATFQETTSGCAIPPYAFPIAAMTWIRIRESNRAHALDLYCLGDCKAFLQLPDQRVVDLDPYVNPQESILQEEISRLSNVGVADADARRARLMPMLRSRREFLNTTTTPSVLCLEPRGPLHAREHTVLADPGSMLLAMTDGFYRIVDTYNLHSVEELAELCLRRGLGPVLEELREFEAASKESASRSVKSSDDASAVTCQFL